MKPTDPRRNRPSSASTGQGAGKPSRDGANRSRRGVPPPPPRAGGKGSGLWLYGLHAVRAALVNPRRTLHQLLATEAGLRALGPAAERRGLKIVPGDSETITRLLPTDAPHQGVALQAAPLPPLGLERVLAEQPRQSTLLLLDQVTDPRNFGAILRGAAALGVDAVVVPERRSADLLSGVAAKAASGALDLVPIVEVVNLARAIGRIKAAGYWVSGLDGNAPRPIEASPPAERRAVVLGSEGSGIRRLVGEACDEILKIPIDPRMESLNVAVAAAVALYALKARDA